VKKLHQVPLIALAILAAVISTACCVESETPADTEAYGFPILSGAYIGQTPPGAEPEIFAPGVVSTGLSELNSVFTPDGKEFYYAVDIGLDWVIMMTAEIDGVWSEPEVVSFTRGHSGVDLCITNDGQRLFYCSNRSRNGGTEPENNFDIWYVDRMEGGGWSDPANLAAVNSDTSEFYPSVTDDGTLYFLSRREGGVGGSDVYRSRLVNGQYQAPENLGPIVNSPGNEGDAFISPDESYLIFNSRGRQGSPGDGSLFISYQNAEGSWSPPQNLGTVMKADRSDFCPMLSPDGRYFFFSSARPRLEDAAGFVTWASLHEAQSRPENGNTDVYWVDAGFIDKLRP
jgi:hypothetical protein